MPRGSPGQRKGGERVCKVCAHPGLKEIEAMLLNNAVYSAVIATAQRNWPEAEHLTKPNLSTHKNNHLLTQPITRVVVGADGQEEKQTFLTGHYEAQHLVIGPEAVPQIPALPDALKIIIAAALHNALNNPMLVTVKDGLEAMKLLKQMGGGGDSLESFLGSWSEVEKIKQQRTTTARRKRTVTVSEEVEMPTETPAQPVDGEWSAADLADLALPAEGETGE